MAPGRSWPLPPGGEEDSALCCQLQVIYEPALEAVMFALVQHGRQGGREATTEKVFNEVGKHEVSGGPAPGRSWAKGVSQRGSLTG